LITLLRHSLLRAGYTINEIVECTMGVVDVKRGRLDSIKNRKWDGWNALVEKTTRSVRKVAVASASPVKMAARGGRRHPRRGSAAHVTMATTTYDSPAACADALSPSDGKATAMKRSRPRRVSIGPCPSPTAGTGSGSTSDATYHPSSHGGFPILRSPILKSPARKVVRFDNHGEELAEDYHPSTNDKNSAAGDIIVHRREFPIATGLYH
jgi:hypothetical protein